MAVEELSLPDRTAAASLWAEADLTRPWNDPLADFDRAVAGPTSTVLGIREDGRLVGTAMVGHDGHRGWVYYLAVSTNRRGQGIGAALMSAAEAWVADAGVPKIQLMVRHTNEGVVAFYRRLGYEDDEVTVLSRRLST